MTDTPVSGRAGLVVSLVAITALFAAVACNGIDLAASAPFTNNPAGLVPLPGDTPLTAGSRIETGLCDRQSLMLNVPAPITSVDYQAAPHAGVDLAILPASAQPRFGAMVVYQPPVVPPPTPIGATPPPTPLPGEEPTPEACETGFALTITILERSSFELAAVPIPGAVLARTGLTSNGPGYLSRMRVDCGDDRPWVDLGQTTGPTGNKTPGRPAVAWQRTLPVPVDPTGCSLQVRWIRTSG